MKIEIYTSYDVLFRTEHTLTVAYIILTFLFYQTSRLNKPPTRGNRHFMEDGDLHAGIANSEPISRMLMPQQYCHGAVLLEL